MRFLADESCDGAVVRAMRAVGHDVTSVRDTMRGASDWSVLDVALLGNTPKEVALNA